MSAERVQKTPAAPDRGNTLFALIGHAARLRLRGMLIWGFALGLYSAMIVATFTTLGPAADRRAPGVLSAGA